METKRTAMHDFEIVEQSLKDMLDHNFIDADCYGSLLPYLKRIKEALEELDKCKEMIARYNEAMEPSIVDDIAFKKVPNSLESAFSDYCFECGNGSDYILLYIKAHDNEPKALLDEAKNLKDGYKREVVGLCLCTDYNIFVPWYKAFLKHCANKEEVNNASLNFQANDILSYYKKGFDKVEDIE